MPRCGSQCWLCDLPVRYDTYVGCSHGCKYCFAQSKHPDLEHIENGEGLSGLQSFVDGGRNLETIAFDWDIPLHIGGMSDPLQPVEKELRRTYNSLKILRESYYPYIISTKGELLTDPEYLEIFDDSNAVVQISMACSMYDRLEPGCPDFERRLEMLREVSPHAKRTIVRVQPYLHEAKDEIINNLPRFADAGAYGIIVEGMKFRKKQKGLVKVGADFCYRTELLRSDFEQVKEAAHQCGLAFLCGENRLRSMGDSLTCCGVEGLDGFRPNVYNLNHLLNGDPQEPTEKMKEKGTARCFQTLNQTTVNSLRIKNTSFADEMIHLLNNSSSYVKSVMGK